MNYSPVITQNCQFSEGGPSSVEVHNLPCPVESWYSMAWHSTSFEQLCSSVFFVVEISSPLTFSHARPSWQVDLTSGCEIQIIYGGKLHCNFYLILRRDSINIIIYTAQLTCSIFNDMKRYAQYHASHSIWWFHYFGKI